MKKIALRAGYIFLGLLGLFVLVFGGLYIRYNSQSAEIHQVVENFVEEIQNENSSSLASYTYPDFTNQLTELLNKYSELFSQIDHVKEDSWYFDYSWYYGVGETTSYQGTVFFDDATSANIVIKLIKDKGVWKVYGLHVKS